MTTVSIYFPAGDFGDVVRRYNEGREQIYQSHYEVARLFEDLLKANQRVNAYSFVTDARGEERPAEGLRIISLGAKDHSAAGLLKSAIAEDNADAIIIHFPHAELLDTARVKRSRVCAVIAGSFNRRGIRAMLERRRTVARLNDPRIELVANHCLPATEHLARIGVKREKLIAWDLSHPFDPASRLPKTLASRRRFEAVYAGSIVPSKGVPDLICAIAALRRQGLEVHCTLAGGGEIPAMQALAAGLDASDLLSFVGLIGNPEVFQLMAAADLVVVPSRTEHTEGFPLSMFEAIASRTPIVCSNHPMFRDVMRDGRNASVFASRDYRALAAAIRRTLTDPVLYGALSTNAALTWASLQGPADWRTLMFKWVVEGRSSAWIRNHMLLAGNRFGTHQEAYQNSNMKSPSALTTNQSQNA